MTGFVDLKTSMRWFRGTHWFKMHESKCKILALPCWKETNSNKIDLGNKIQKYFEFKDSFICSFIINYQYQLVKIRKNKPKTEVSVPKLWKGRVPGYVCLREELRCGVVWTVRNCGPSPRSVVVREYGSAVWARTSLPITGCPFFWCTTIQNKI